MRLHLLQVNVVVELDYVNFLRVFILWIQRNFDIDPGDTVRLRDIDLPTARFLEPVFMNFLVSIDNVLKFETLLAI